MRPLTHHTQTNDGIRKNPPSRRISHSHETFLMDLRDSAFMKPPRLTWADLHCSRKNTERQHRRGDSRMKAASLNHEPDAGVPGVMITSGVKLGSARRGPIGETRLL